MTVKELIERLSELPGDAIVTIDYEVHVNYFEWEEEERDIEEIFCRTWYNPGEVHLRTYKED